MQSIHNSFRILNKLKFSLQIFRERKKSSKYQVSKIRPVGAELFNADRHTDDDSKSYHETPEPRQSETARAG
jgi:hypothetical protein